MEPSREEDAMTTPTIAEVSHSSKKPTVVEIDGFRGRLISADHADYDCARAVWNGAINRRPRLIARLLGGRAAPQVSRDRSATIRSGHATVRSLSQREAAMNMKRVPFLVMLAQHAGMIMLAGK
jgi:hypothetical protein